jgi:hypothetical protein
LEDPVLRRNLSEPEVGKVLFDPFKTAINALTIREAGLVWIEDRSWLRNKRPFRPTIDLAWNPRNRYSARLWMSHARAVLN